MDASLTNKVFYANPNRESKKFVKPEVANNPTVFLSPDDLQNMVPPDVPEQRPATPDDAHLHVVQDRPVARIRTISRSL